MVKASDWLVDIAINKEAENMLCEKLLLDRDRYFHPTDYTVKIIEQIKLDSFDQSFNVFKKEAAIASHKSYQIPLLEYLRNNIEIDPSFLSKGDLSLYNNKTCFIYFFTVEKEFDTTHSNYTQDKEDFLKNHIGDEGCRAWYKKKPNGNKIEKLVYIGESTDLITRIEKHSIFRKLHHWRYNAALKYMYIASVVVDEELEYEALNGERKECIIETPLDTIRPINLADNILRYLESMLIAYFQIPDFNLKDTVPKILLFRNDIEDSWDKLPFVSKITLCNFDKSIFFEQDHKIDKKKRNELFASIPNDELIVKAKKAGINIDSLLS